MIPWLATVAAAQEIELGVGRAAVLSPNVVPTSVTVSDSAVLDVVPSPPALLLIARKPGLVTLSVESDRGTFEWTVTVQPGGDVPPSGGGVAPQGDVITLPLRDAVWCRFPGVSAMTFLETGIAAVEPTGTDRYLVEGIGAGTADIVFDTARGPKVVTVVVGGSGAFKAPPACHRGAETVPLTVGQTVNVPVGRHVQAIVVGQPDVVTGSAVLESPDTLRLVGLRPGVTTVLVRSRDDEDPWVRSVVVAPKG